MSYYCTGYEGCRFLGADDAANVIDDEPDYPEEIVTELSAMPVGGAAAAPAFAWPIASPSYVRRNSFAAKMPSGKPHGALDMGAGGDAVLATAAGKVVLARDTKDARGRAVVLDLGNGWEVRHYHLASFAVARGDEVVQGQQIGVVGATGLPKNNPHLHFEVRRGGVAIDPVTLLPERTTEGGPVATNWPLLVGGAVLVYYALKG